jgi:type II secretory pathway predicted ATPase ExeA
MTDDLFVLWRRLADRIQEFRAIGSRGVLLLDNADEAIPDVLRHVVRLIQCDPSAESPVTTIVAAQAERLTMLGGRLLGLASLRVDVTALEADETRQFVVATLASAGCPGKTFDEQALDEIHTLSGGNPRRIYQLTDLALLAGAGDQLQTIDRQTVRAAHEELAVR